MEGLNVIEKSYNTLLRFKNALHDSNMVTASSLVINMTQFDAETQSLIKETIRDIITVYKDELEISNISQALSTNNIRIEFPENVDGFKDDLIDALDTIITKRSSELYAIISNSSNGGGLYNV